MDSEESQESLMPKQKTAERVLQTWENFSLSGRILESVDSLRDYLVREQKVRIQTVNLQHIYVASRSNVSHEDLRAATVVTADGWPLSWYTKANQRRAVERVTGRQALDVLLEGSTPHTRIATIGGSREAGDSLDNALKPLGKALVYRNEAVISDSDFASIVDDVARAQPDFVLTALGSPRGETLGRMMHDRPDIQAVIIGVGGAVEMWHGSTPAAPAWAQRMRCEWLYRLAKEPKRLFRRYVVECAPLMGTMVKRVSFARIRRS